jgi:hypothetical protein
LKILADTSERLIVEEKPWFLGGLLIFFALIAIAGLFQAATERDLALGGVMIVMLIALYFALTRGVRRAWLILDKRQGEILWRVRDFRGKNERRWSLEKLENAVVEVNRDEGETYRISVKITGEDEWLPLTPYFSSFAGYEPIVDRIKSFRVPT